MKIKIIKPNLNKSPEELTEIMRNSELSTAKRLQAAEALAAILTQKQPKKTDKAPKT